MKPQIKQPTEVMDRYRSSLMCSLGVALGHAIRWSITAGFLFFIWRVLRHVLPL